MLFLPLHVTRCIHVTLHVAMHLLKVRKKRRMRCFPCTFFDVAACFYKGFSLVLRLRRRTGAEAVQERDSQRVKTIITVPFIYLYTSCATPDGLIESMANTIVFHLSGAVMVVTVRRLKSRITISWTYCTSSLPAWLGRPWHHGRKCMDLTFNIADALVTWWAEGAWACSIQRHDGARRWHTPFFNRDTVLFPHQEVIPLKS